MLNPRIRIASAGRDMGIFNFLQDMQEHSLRQQESIAEKIASTGSIDDFLKAALALFNLPSPPPPGVPEK
jgi:hypothetical protein